MQDKHCASRTCGVFTASPGAHTHQPVSLCFICFQATQDLASATCSSGLSLTAGGGFGTEELPGTMLLKRRLEHQFFRQPVLPTPLAWSTESVHSKKKKRLTIVVDIVEGLKGEGGGPKMAGGVKPDIFKFALLSCVSCLVACHFCAPPLRAPLRAATLPVWVLLDRKSQEKGTHKIDSPPLPPVPHPAPQKAKKYEKKKQQKKLQEKTKEKKRRVPK